MNLHHRIELLAKLGDYISSDSPEWVAAKERAANQNNWFTPEFVDKSATSISEAFLKAEILQAWAESYSIPDVNEQPHTIGIVMAGNIPMVGFHDLLSAIITGHKPVIKLSSKDEVLIRHLAEKLSSWSDELNADIRFESMLKGCDAYIATGSNNSAGYFEYYFKKYPHIIRKNKTSVAILTGEESSEDISLLADDVFLYFGLGCRNVTKIFVPEDYDFVPLINAFKKYNYLADHHKYKNNYDYNLAILLLNKNYYMSTEALLLVESDSVFSPISQLNYSFYSDQEKLIAGLASNDDLQGIIGRDYIPFGQSQYPKIYDYADRIDTIEFLVNLQK